MSLQESRSPVMEAPGARRRHDPVGGGGIETFVPVLATRFLELPATRRTLRDTIQSLAWAVGVDHCGIAQFTDDGRRLRWTLGLGPRTPPSGLLPWYTDRIRQGLNVILERLPGDLPAEAEAEAAFVAAAGLKSHLAVPLRAGGEILGCLGLGSFHEFRTWTPEFVSSMALLAGVLASALQRQRDRARRRTAEALSDAVFEAFPEPLLVMDAQGRVVRVGRGWAARARCADCLAPEPGALFLDEWERARGQAAREGRDALHAVLAGRQESFESRYHCSRPPHECDVRLVMRPLGAGGGALVVESDVSALERSRAELKAARTEIREYEERAQAEAAFLRKAMLRTTGFDEIVGTSTPLARVLHQVEQVAAADSPVLILGETGTGKELLARAIHERSRRSNRPLVSVNCAALPDALVESELFGYEKGAFTGAVARTPGRFEAAHGGSILLDEIGELPLAAQAKLLRVLESGTFERLGSSKSIRVDVRVIAATNRDIEKELREGRFRADLYYRLNVFPIVAPPLRERVEDIPLLVWHFINARQGPLGRAIEHVPERLMRALQAYAWPGNVRELENVIERALLLSKGTTLTIDAAFLNAGGERVPALGTTLDDVQRTHIEEVLRQCGWKVAGKGNAAERLGLKRGTLQFRMKKLGVRRPGAVSG